MLKTKQQIKFWLGKYEITNYTINDDLSIDVSESVGLWNHNLTEIPVQFNEVNGYFSIEGNQLKSLKGCPRIVKGNFICDNNNLTSLKFSPEIVNGGFLCRLNPDLKSLEGINLKGLRLGLIVDDHLKEDPIYLAYKLRQKIKEMI